MQVLTSWLFCLQMSMALSALTFKLTGFLPRKVPSVVISTVQAESRMRSARDSAEKPPKTIEWTAPMRAQASMAMHSWGTMGM